MQCEKLWDRVAPERCKPWHFPTLNKGHLRKAVNEWDTKMLWKTK
nr:MAG TPA: hypothetical protein [Bacteriophage sp.]